MYTLSCPGCGASITFRSHASVMAVCEYCQTSVLKTPEAVQDLGKLSDVLEDYSVLQLGTSGVWKSRSFTLIGRIQLRYPAGFWNEWYIGFDDGETAWLSDASGLYTLTVEHPVQPGAHLPAWKDCIAGQPCRINGKNYTVADVRQAECIAGQGELPFQVQQGWQAKVVDARHDSSFITLDYSHSETPVLYVGEAVTPETLHCQLLRDAETIQASAGKFKGQVTRLECALCGYALRHVPGVTTHLICSSCSAHTSTAGATAQVLASGERLKALKTTLELGARGTISGATFDVIGLMQRRDEENTHWTEYLLYNPRAGFLWLIETQEGWSRAQVKSLWPTWTPGKEAVLGGHTFKIKWDYTAEVTFAAGAFNWQVNVGERARVIEFEGAGKNLAAEITAAEMTWSLSHPVPADQIRAWFGEHIKAGSIQNRHELLALSKRFMMYLLVINCIPLLFAFTETWFYLSFALAAIYYPAKFLGRASAS